MLEITRAVEQQHLCSTYETPGMDKLVTHPGEGMRVLAPSVKPMASKQR